MSRAIGDILGNPVNISGQPVGDLNGKFNLGEGVNSVDPAADP